MSVDGLIIFNLSYEIVEIHNLLIYIGEFGAGGFIYTELYYSKNVPPGFW